MECPLLGILLCITLINGFTNTYLKKNAHLQRGFRLAATTIRRSVRAENTAYVGKAPSVWSVFGDLATSTNAINLGQGFPDWDPPAFVKESLHAAVDSDFHQYTRPAGHPALVELLSERYSRHLKHPVDPMREVAVTVGASQALYLSLVTLVRPGDEVVVFDPFFELYKKQIDMVGATAKFVPLGGNQATLEDPFALDIDALDEAITDDTRVLILNSPHNPTGKVFSSAELVAIAAIVRKHPKLVVLSDEVYKFTVYNPTELGDTSVVGHSHFARLPDMWDRTLTISSCGKTFSVTGWQVGWCVGPERLISPIHEALPLVQFCAPTPMQEALSGALAKADLPYDGFDNYYEWLRQQFTNKRAILEQGLLAAGIEPVPAQGGYFLLGRLDPHTPGVSSYGPPGEAFDFRFCRQLIDQKGVAAIPASPFFSEGRANLHGPSYARFAFCKRDETLREAARRLGV